MGYRIREQREKLKLTQEQLAEKSGVCRETIVALENDKARNTTTKTLLKLASAMSVSVESLFFDPSV